MTFSFFMALYVHISACGLLIISNLTKESMPSWLDSVDPEYSSNQANMYIVAFYFVGTTITTVGYGDFSPSNSYERMFGLMLMIIGISAFGYMSGTLSSILSNYDSNAAENLERLLLLNQFRVKYEIPDELYAEVRTTIKAHDTQ